MDPKWINLRFDPNQPGGGKSNSETALQAEVDAWKNRFNDLKKQHDELAVKHSTLENDHGKLQKQHDDAIGELGGFKATRARKEMLGKLLAKPEFKGKMNVDVDKAMTFLDRGAYDEATLEKDVRSAIEFVGAPIKPPENPLGSRSNEGGGSDRSANTPSPDPIGDFARGMGR